MVFTILAVSSEASLISRIAWLMRPMAWLPCSTLPLAWPDSRLASSVFSPLRRVIEAISSSVEENSSMLAACCEVPEARDWLEDCTCAAAEVTWSEALLRPSITRRIGPVTDRVRLRDRNGASTSSTTAPPASSPTSNHSSDRIAAKASVWSISASSTQRTPKMSSGVNALSTGFPL